MAILKIVKHGNPILRKRARPVAEVDEKLLALARDMIETMYAEHGIGLAANQVGSDARLLVIDTSEKGKRNPIILFNAEILSRSGRLFEEEGCLSVPGFSSRVKRAKEVVARGLNEKGEPVQILGRDLLARALQHEIDHLDGKLFVHRLPFFTRMKAWLKIRRLKKKWR